KDGGQIHLSVAQRAEPAGALQPSLIAGIATLSPIRVEFGILDEKGRDALVIAVYEGAIVELLQQNMRRIVIDRAALVPLERVEKHPEGHPVEDVLRGMKLVADIDALVLIGVKDRLPASGKLGKCLVNQASRPLRERVEI